eukprot:TRINITY_DN16639_c0_g1_i1.p1 TRINITY_DN16639_c0_g1~~TRINITY_DN16639_c0_g1_i1.p1  ORF type:complete len:145 (+),score=12.32 TRINITY_DN16639_c0_g1_i1:51-437(+)
MMRRIFAVNPSKLLRVQTLSLQMMRQSSDWPRPDLVPPVKKNLSHLVCLIKHSQVPPYMRRMYIKAAYYPEYKFRSDNPETENATWTFLNTLLFHFFFVPLYVFLYFTCFRRIGQDYRVNINSHLIAG